MAPTPSTYSDDVGRDYEWLLDDHPLRSYPTECGPGLVFSVRGWYHAARGKGKGNAWVFGLVCLLLGGLVFLQTLTVIPHGISYVQDVVGWRADNRAWEQTQRTWTPCLTYSPLEDPHSDPIQTSPETGCAGVKTDVWLYNDQLLVGSSVRHLETQQTLQRVYLDPLLRRFEALRPDEDPALGFVLLLELKTSAHALWPYLAALLEPLRNAGHLTHLDGSRVIPGRLTVVVSGRGTADGFRGVDNAQSDIFLDASLDELTLEDYASPSALGRPRVGLEPDPLRGFYCATANFQESIGTPRRGRFSEQQIALIRAQVRAAHQRGLRARYEGIPRGHAKQREIVWRELAREGADLVERSN
ncbi:hypothetical protein PHISP_07617 [Aspergillus sp. HF37]|nr:hypothetical protein PHISP_07617 [Aspergillus sp. HF37]